MKGKKVAVLAVLVISLLFFSASVYAQIPQRINYQGYLTDPGGNPINGTVSIVFSLYSVIAGGSPLWTENHSVAVNSGVFNVILGDSNLAPTPVDLPFDQPYYLGIRVGSDAEMTPRKALSSVGYAFRAYASETDRDTLGGLNCSNGQVAKWDGSGWACAEDNAGGTPSPTVANLDGASLAGTSANYSRGDHKHGVNSGSLTGAMIADGSISTAKIGDGQVTNAKITGPIDGSKIALTGLNADTVDGQHANAFASVSHAHSGTDITSGTVAEPRIDALIARTSSLAPLNEHTARTDNPHATTAAQVGAAAVGHAHSGADITSGTIAEPRIDAAIARDSEVVTGISSHAASPSAHHTRYTNAEAVAAILASDGTGSGLDADLLDGKDASTFASSTHNHNTDYVNVAGDTMTGALSINQGAVSGSAATIQITTPANTSPAVEAATSGQGAAVRGTNSGITGPAGYFQITNSNSAAHALQVATNGTGYGHGIYSYSTGLSRAGFFEINNASNGGEAILARTNGTGQAFHGTTTGTSNAGFFDITNASNSAEALYVSTDGTGRSGYFQISNVSSGSDALYATTNGTGNAIKGYTTGSGFSGFFQGGAGLYVAGNLNVTGNLTKGSGSFVQPYKKDPSKEIVYAFFEGPEHAIFLRGKAKLVDGRAVIETPEYFRDVAGSDEDITVQFTPRSSRSKGLAAVEVTKDSVRVEELMEGKGTYEFDYFITAKRAGFEGHEPVQKNTHFSAHNATQEEFERRYADTSDLTVRALREMLIASGILTKDGRLNRDVAEMLGWKVKDQEYALK